MKNLLRFISVAFVAIILTTNVKAQLTVSDVATATATIIAPLTIAKAVDMNFGNLAVIGGAPGTCILGTDNSRLQTGGTTLAATVAGVIKAAVFDFTGSDGYTVIVTLPLVDCIVTSGLNTMNVNTWVSNPPAPSFVFSGSTQVLSVGATLNVSGTQAPGVYTSATPFIVTASYQ